MKLHHLPFYGRVYRAVMKLAHRLHWHYAPPIYPDGDTMLWCKWCGLRQIVRKRDYVPAISTTPECGGGRKGGGEMKIWIVHGSTGEYSDRMEWVVEAHDTEAAAQARVKRLAELLQGMGSYDTWDRRKAMKKAMREHPEGDPRCDIDYTGTSWYLSECELKQS